MSIDTAREEIKKGIDAYNKHLDKDFPSIKIGEDFVKNFSKESFTAKGMLRNMLRQHPLWNEDKMCVVKEIEIKISLNRKKVDDLLIEFFYTLLSSHERAFFHDFFLNEEYCPDYLEDFIKFAGNAYKADRKKSRILRQLCKQKGWDKIDGFEKWFAEISNELNTKTKKVDLIVSINPAHFLTMSNPHHDSRGEMLTSCHSLNADYEYRNGCTGYALDAVTMIAFTVDNTADEESWCNRKTSRQLFMYEPGSGVLLQSRMYNANGGTTGQQAESEGFRKAIEEIISVCENTPNEWDSGTYTSKRFKKKIAFEENDFFGGYPDWKYEQFNAILSTRKGYIPKVYFVGNIGMCLNCGKHTEDEEGIYCEACDEELTEHVCEFCGKKMHHDESLEAYYHGDIIKICDHCANSDDFVECNDCGCLYHIEDTEEAQDSGVRICENCLENSDTFARCYSCDGIYHKSNLTTTTNADGMEIPICHHCATL